MMNAFNCLVQRPSSFYTSRLCVHQLGNFVLIKCLCVHRFQMGGWEGVNLVQIIWARVTVLKVNAIKVELSRVYVSERSFNSRKLCYLL